MFWPFDFYMGHGSPVSRWASFPADFLVVPFRWVWHGLRMNRTGMGVIGRVCGVELMGGLGSGVRSSGVGGGSWDWSRSVWWSRAVGWDGLDMLGEMIVVTGSDVVWRGRLGSWTGARGGLVGLCWGDMEGLGLSQRDALSGGWIRRIKGATGYPGSPGKMDIKTVCVCVCVSGCPLVMESYGI